MKKLKGFWFWPILIIISGGIAGYFLPEHALKYFFELLTNLIVS